ncbi:MAG: YfcE family phosphodiesterase [Microbacterium sp. 71-36]|uniref:metallophosphoesterase family protein n=1 Tax=unclassified Microbacterium TaxID=2609290 RepID=UPI000869E35C|nr:MULTISPECIES: metallophosphoesterase [unclassified Microbacterium]MBN9210855.1 metallophosphoesterase [Microbacterium sp.]ODT38755.1 MAG: YfcE family phosphodiesterase [Microbacterium sp. SCN 71-17]ODU51982.1 MAG: YfcE family phosphodiesterase [Microbacterium sp. SCN 70-10]OJV75650.1 MAG: YfcE family phosphodiesterase [Microbacterium sp. 71-36]
MTTRLLLIADTHVPKRARSLPEAVRRAASGVDLVVHAGDWVTASVLDDLAALAPVLGVWGNNDGADLRDRLPEVARAEIDGVRVAVIHETGPAAGREKRMDAAFPDADLLVFGHSHIPWDAVTPAGMRLLNPGSPTDRRRQPACTMMTLTLADGAVRETRLLEVARD